MQRFPQSRTLTPGSELQFPATIEASSPTAVRPGRRDLPGTPLEPVQPLGHDDQASKDESVTLPAERSEVASRVLNVVVASLALLVLAPVCVIVALAVKLTSRGPVFYTQTRVGLDRRW